VDPPRHADLSTYDELDLQPHSTASAPTAASQEEGRREKRTGEPERRGRRIWVEERDNGKRTHRFSFLSKIGTLFTYSIGGYFFTVYDAK